MNKTGQRNKTGQSKIKYTKYAESVNKTNKRVSYFNFTLTRFISLCFSLFIMGCTGGNDSRNSVITPVDENTNSDVVLSIVNPITDITLMADTALNFSIPDDTCNAAEGVDIQYEILSVENNVGFTLIDFRQLSGKATQLGEVNVQVSCATDSSTLTDEFIITVVDIEVVPSVTITSPSLANVDDVISLTATAKNNNLFGSIVSYSWTETSNLGVHLINANSETVTFTTPDTTQQSTAAFSVTVTDNAGSTTTDSVEILFISTLAPEITLSFPLAFGVYNEDAIDMFGNVKTLDSDSIGTVKVIVNDTKYDAIITDDIWRIEDITLSKTVNIEIWATSANGFINYEEVNLSNDTLYSTSLDYDISDLAVNEDRDDLYIQMNGDYASQTQFALFNLTSAKNNILTVNQPNDYLYSAYIPTSIDIDETTNSLFVSYETGISKIDLATGDESILSDSTTGTGTTPAYIFDLSYDPSSKFLYFTDFSNKTITVVNTDTGDRTELQNSITDLLSITVNSATGDFYYSQGVSIDAQTLIREYDNTAVAFSTLYDVTVGGPVSDIAINEENEELFFVDDTGSVVKVDLADYSITQVIESLFAIEDVVDAQTPLIALHYHAERNVLIAAGKGTDDINKLLIIDPVSGNYAKVASE